MFHSESGKITDDNWIIKIGKASRTHYDELYYGSYFMVLLTYYMIEKKPDQYLGI